VNVGSYQVTAMRGSQIAAVVPAMGDVARFLLLTLIMVDQPLEVSIWENS
jgi:hypothetical protein